MLGRDSYGTNLHCPLEMRFSGAERWVLCLHITPSMGRRQRLTQIFTQH